MTSFKIIAFLLAITTIAKAQSQIVVDGDVVHLTDSLNAKISLLKYIERGDQNKEAIWITYDRRPGVDPWIRNAKDKSKKFTDENFIEYWEDKNVKILGAITTYDDCRCSKNRTADSPDMYLIHFKVYQRDWDNMRDFYPEIESHLTEVKLTRE